jgi:hypothetical protein
MSASCLRYMVANRNTWPRAWKVRVIHAMNPDRDNLYDMQFHSC